MRWNWLLVVAAVFVVGCTGRRINGGDDDATGDGDSDSDADADADSDSDSDADSDSDSDSDSDADSDADGDGDSDPCDGAECCGLQPCDVGFRCNADGQCEDLSTVGDACVNDNDCEGPGRDCIGDAEGWDGGYCTQDCNPNAQDCPEGDVCSGSGMCFKSCDRTSDCREDYVCGGGNFPQACIPTCENNIFCGNGTYCDVDGSCDNSRGNAVDWTRCTDDECDGLCLTEADLSDAPAGFTNVCTHICTGDDPCANGYKCVPFGDTISLCLKNCTQDSNCNLGAGSPACLDTDGNGTADGCWFL